MIAAAAAAETSAAAASHGGGDGLEIALTGFTAYGMGVAITLVGVSLLLTFVRLVKGPTLADRVVALDLVTMILVVILTLFGMSIDDSAYIDAAIALGLVAFLATVAFARYIERLPRVAAGEKPEPIEDYSSIDNRVEESRP
jgi:multicomponent Na+:H+ antiporter subunit F